jgi:hypothetical protein
MGKTEKRSFVIRPQGRIFGKLRKGREGQRSHLCSVMGTVVSNAGGTVPGVYM